jgi:hypothetical protein
MTCVMQEAGAALCDALIDYVYPSAAQRETVLSQPLFSFSDQQEVITEVLVNIFMHAMPIRT